MNTVFCNLGTEIPLPPNIIATVINGIMEEIEGLPLSNQAKSAMAMYASGEAVKRTGNMIMIKSIAEMQKEIEDGAQ